MTMRTNTSFSSGRLSAIIRVMATSAASEIRRSPTASVSALLRSRNQEEQSCANTLVAINKWVVLDQKVEQVAAFSSGVG